ncbi:MAG TPA: rod-binding protein [bacterium]|nr:rod-binding protein [bacterium]HQO35147.1 rod-binding protein [bacterium]HQP97868.1 rod-binding protein [bacterium]
MSDDLLLGSSYPQASAMVDGGRMDGDIKRLQNLTEKSSGKMNEKQMREIASDFEGILVRQLIKEMRNTVPQDGFLEPTHATEMYQEMADDALAKDLAGQGGFGIADLVYEQLKEIQDNLHTSESILKQMEENKEQFLSLPNKTEQSDSAKFIPMNKKSDPVAGAIPFDQGPKFIPMPERNPYMDFTKPVIPLDKVERR